MATQPPETEIVDKMRVACDGGGGALGHPRVWLELSRVRGMVECSYCDKRFVHRDFEQDVMPAGGDESGPELKSETGLKTET